MNKIQLRKIPSVGNAISDSFSLLGRNFKDLFQALLLIGGPFFLLLCLMVGVTISMPQLMESNSFGFVFGISATLSALIGAWSFGLYYAILLKYVKLYVHSSDGKVDRAELREGIWHDTLRILAAVLVSVVMMFLGFICFIIPGIYLSYVFQVLYPVVIEENLSTSDSIRRCFNLVEGHWGKTFGYFLIIGLIVNAGSYLIQVPLFLIVGLSDILGLTSPWILGLGGAFFTAGFFVLLTLLLSIQAIAGAVWYYGLAEQLDGTSSLEALDQIGKTNDLEETTW